VTLYGYDVLGNQTFVKDAAGRITTMSYDAVNRLVEKTLPNGVKTVYSYNDLDQVSKIETKNGAGTVLSSLTYERSGIGEPTKITREDGSFVTYGYDGALRLTRESYFGTTGTLQSEISYTYDASGKRLTKNSEVYAYNNGYQLQGVTGANGAETYGYDADGRVSTINRDGGTLNLSHDNYDRLTQANGTSYLYDGEGRRIRAVSGADERRFLQASNGGLDVTELLTDAAGNVISDYVYGNGSVPISRLDASGNPIYYLTDAMGSVIGEVDGDGNVVSRFSYDAFGNVRSQSGLSSTATGGDFRFQGQWLESDSGLYYFRARDYDARTGLFLSRDAMEPEQGEPENANPYQFAYQNPLIYSDPSGNFTLLEINTSEYIQKSLNALQQSLYNNARQQVIDRAKRLPAELLQSAISRFFPFEGSFLNAFSDPDTTKSGKTFESALTLNLCALMGNFSKTLDELWLQVPVYKTGEPAGNGYGCKIALGLGQKPSNVGLGNPSYPDFIIKKGLPKQTDRNPEAFLIGDVTRQLESVLGKVRKTNGQGGAILNYASPFPGKRHTQIPAALFLTLFGGSQSTYEKIIRISVTGYGVIPLIAVFLSENK
jgi:RHS repeat-associated protein